MLDVRRPRDKPTKEAQEEQLIPYGPIPDERKMYASYSLEVKTNDKDWFEIICMIVAHTHAIILS